MTEDELLEEITSAADKRGLLWHHCPDSRRCQGRRGQPDLLLVGKDILFVELKDEDGETSVDQDMWLWRLHEIGIGYVVWKPGDWCSGRVQSALDELRWQ